jgi:hypothetical protein
LPPFIAVAIRYFVVLEYPSQVPKTVEVVEQSAQGATVVVGPAEQDFPPLNAVPVKKNVFL